MEIKYNSPIILRCIKCEDHYFIPHDIGNDITKIVNEIKRQFVAGEIFVREVNE